MKLSEAVNIGIVSIEFNPWSFFAVNSDGQCQGCLLGAAWLAVNGAKRIDSHFQIIEQWPWLHNFMPVPRDLVCSELLSRNRSCALDIISSLAFSITRKEVTLEQAVDWIRSVEPEEPKTEAELNAEWKQELVEMST